MSRPSIVLLLVTIGLPACGGGSTSPSSPATPPPSASATITIGASGVSPRQVEIPVGGRVAFVNNDSASHNMSSDPHPSHTECPALNEVGNLAAGRSGITGALNTARTCGFHDHDRSSDTSLQGTIVIR